MFRAKHLQVGIIGEQLATEFLKKEGFRIITRNYKAKWSEIDIIAVNKNKTLRFIEVKTLASYNKEIRQPDQEEISLKPEDNLTRAKLEKLQKACAYFANRNPNLVDNEKGWQIDLIAITIFKNPENLSLLTNNEKDFVIMYYENIAL